MDHKIIGNNILHFLNEKNLTQVDLANGIGSSRQVVNKIVKGKKAIKTEEIITISSFLEVELEKILLGNFEIASKIDERAQLCGEIKNQQTAEFIFELISNLSEMEEILDENHIK